MQLQIKDNSGLLDNKFAEWLVNDIQKQIIVNIDVNRFKQWDEYLNEKEVFNTTYLKTIKSLDIVYEGIQSLTYTVRSPYIRIFINKQKYVPGLDRVPLYVFCDLINYGDLSLNGYPIFTDVFRDIEENFSKYVERYINEPII